MNGRPEVSRRSLLVGSAAGAAWAGLGTTPAQAAAQGRPDSNPPNVLIVKSDEHNPFVTSVTGRPFVQTPNMAGLAARGTVFESAYCPSPLCAPSRSSYLSGLPPHKTQVYNNCLAVTRPNFPTYGGVLAEQGIHTAFVGKVDAYRPPAELGFSEMKGDDFRTPGDINVRRVPVPVRDDGPSRAAGVGVKSTDKVRELTRQIQLRFCDPEAEQDRAERFIEQQISVMEAQGIHVP